MHLHHFDVIHLLYLHLLFFHMNNTPARATIDYVGVVVLHDIAVDAFVAAAIPYEIASVLVISSPAKLYGISADIVADGVAIVVVIDVSVYVFVVIVAVAAVTCLLLLLLLPLLDVASAIIVSQYRFGASFLFHGIRQCNKINNNKRRNNVN